MPILGGRKQKLGRRLDEYAKLRLWKFIFEKGGVACSGMLAAQPN